MKRAKKIHHRWEWRPRSGRCTRCGLRARIHRLPSERPGDHGVLVPKWLYENLVYRGPLMPLCTGDRKVSAAPIPRLHPGRYVGSRPRA